MRVDIPEDQFQSVRFEVWPAIGPALAVRRTKRRHISGRQRVLNELRTRRDRLLPVWRCGMGVVHPAMRADAHAGIEGFHRLNGRIPQARLKRLADREEHAVDLMAAEYFKGSVGIPGIRRFAS